MDKSKSPMAFAAHELSVVCDEMDGADKIDQFLDRFEDASLTLSDAVDRRIAVDREFKIRIAAAEEGYRYYRAAKEHLEAVHTRFKERTKAVIETSSEGVQEAFRGKLGKISLCNSPPSVEYAFATKELTLEAADFFGVPRHYLITKTTYQVDTALVKAELQTGEQLGWATLKLGRHIRFPAAPKSKEIEA